MTKTVSAYEARTKFGELMNEVYYKGTEVIITKNGRPFVKMIKYKKPRNKNKPKNSKT